MTRDECLAALSRALGVETPDEDTIDSLLQTAGLAAHASERTAAPIATYLVGRSGLPLQQAVDIVRDALE
jgi:hypothetical protein